MALARSIREGLEWNMQKLKKKKNNASVRRREIIGAADLGAVGEERSGGGISSSSGSINSSDSGAVVAFDDSPRSRSRGSCYSATISSSCVECSSSRGAHCKSSISSSRFADVAPRAKRLVSPQGRKKAMGWMRKISGPFRRAWDIVSCRQIHQSRKRSRGMGRLYNDVRSCGYDDVHLMWSMLQTHNVETSKWRRLSRRHSRAPR